MNPSSFSTAHIDYLTRSGFAPTSLGSNVPRTSASPPLRRLLRILGIGRLEKEPIPKADPNAPAPSQDVLMGLYGYKIPLAFLLRGSPEGISYSLGSWSPEDEGADRETLQSRQEILRTVLDSLFPHVQAVAEEPLTPGLPLGGIALGIPTTKAREQLESGLPIDRLIRAMSGSHWACLVLAQPVEESFIRELRLSVINEMRSVETETAATKAPSPLAQYYLKLLEPVLMNLTYGESLGGWRTAVYLLGDSMSYYRLASAWRGIFSGQDSLLERVQVWDSPHAIHLAKNWALPDVMAPDGPGHFRHAFDLQTMLTSQQLAVYIHLPELEVPGFRIELVPDFDAVPPPLGEGSALNLGRVLHRARPTSTSYGVNLDHLTRHAFITGVTGAGKTNTIFHILKEVTAAGIPFMVIEPAKTEYRELLRDPSFGAEMIVYTLGDEQISPMRLNPFEPVPGTPVGVHLDLLRSVFSASFGMWTPLPQILEVCLHEIYQDRGWDITSNSNPRLSPDTEPASSFPTLSDLVVKINAVTEQLGYGGEVTGNVRAALRTRINGLRTGGKGRMLDVQTSLPMEDLLRNPTVVELEGIGDDSDKAFLMGLLLIRLVECMRAGGAHDGLRHLLIIEEAHRLLANTGGPKSQEEADPRGKAVETFANMLSEIRAYGQGVLIADQVPIKLAPEVIKNTNLKVVHRIVALDDRATLAGAMAMSERQARTLATLRVGEAVVFSEGDDSPIVVKVPIAKHWDETPGVSDEEIHERAVANRQRGDFASIFRTYSSCIDHCQVPNENCLDLRKHAEGIEISDTIDAFILSTALTEPDEKAADHMISLFPDVRTSLLPAIPPAGDMSLDVRCLLTHGLSRHLQDRGALYGWDYSVAGELRSLLLPSISALTMSGEINRKGRADLKAFCGEYKRLHAREGPYYGCANACQGSCFFRHAVRQHAERARMQDPLRRAISANDQERLDALRAFAASRVLFPSIEGNYRRQAGMCLVIQEIDAWRDLGWDRRRELVDQTMLSDSNAEGGGG